MVAVEIIQSIHLTYEFNAARNADESSAEMFNKTPDLDSEILTIVLEPVSPSSGNNDFRTILETIGSNSI